MQTVTVVDDISLGHRFSQMVCDCGWFEKTHPPFAEGLSKMHVRLKHTTGAVNINGTVLAVT